MDIDMDTRPTRRQALAALAGLGVGGVASVVGVGSADAQATIDSDGFAVKSAEYAAADGTLYTPWLDVVAQWGYEGVADAAGVLVATLVDGSLLTTREQSTDAPQDQGSTDLEAPLIESRAFETDDWNVPDGEEELRRTVDVELLLEVRDANGETLANAAATDSVKIVVTDAGPAMVAAVGGQGSVAFQANESADEPV